MNGIKIVATGMYVPASTITNDDIATIVETSDEWIKTRSGISSRHYNTGEPLWKMELAACEQALERAGMSADKLDLIIHTGISNDYITPSMACVLQGKLGAVNATGFDINAACAAFVYALDMARRYIVCGDVQNVLIISGEMLSRAANYQDRSTCFLFGDGAAATIVTAADAPFASYLRADGTGAKYLFARRRYDNHPFMGDNQIQAYDDFEPWEDEKIYMDGREVYKFSTRVMGEAVRGATEKLGITPEDLDLIVPHQANYRIVETAMARLGLPMEKAALNIERYGNTSSASIPICLNELNEQGKLKRGDKICVVGFGAGLIYGAAVFEW